MGRKVQELTEDAVLVSPRLLLARSTASEKQWKEKTEEIFQQEGDFIEKIRYRPSQGGATIAVPPVLQEHKDRRRKEGNGDEAKRNQVIIRLRGEFIETRSNQAEKIMKMMAEEAQIQIDEEESGVVSGKKQWKKMVDARTGWKGDVLLRCAAVEEGIKLFRSVEGKTIEVGEGGKITVEIIPHASVVQEARNGGPF